MPYRVKTYEQAPISDERSAFHDLHVHETSAWPEIPLASPSRAHHALYQVSSQGRSQRLAGLSHPASRVSLIYGTSLSNAFKKGRSRDQSL